MPSPAQHDDAQTLLTEGVAQPDGATVPEIYLTMAGLRERGWTDAMVRDYLGEPDATRPNPRYRSAAPMKLYLAQRAEAAEAGPGWAERKVRGARRRAVGLATADRMRAETETPATLRSSCAGSPLTTPVTH